MTHRYCTYDYSDHQICTVKFKYAGDDYINYDVANSTDYVLNIKICQSNNDCCNLEDVDVTFDNYFIWQSSTLGSCHKFTIDHNPTVSLLYEIDFVSDWYYCPQVKVTLYNNDVYLATIHTPDFQNKLGDISYESMKIDSNCPNEDRQPCAIDQVKIVDKQPFAHMKKYCYFK